MWNLIKQDLKLIGRDRFLLMMFGFVFYIALVLRYLLPWLNGYLATKGILPSTQYPYHLSDFYVVIVSFFTVFEGALLAGTIFGFMLLDEKDERSLKALLVTPISFEKYLFKRLVLPIVLSFVCIFLELLIIGLAPLPWWQWALFSLAGALTGPICMLFLGAFAENKVQGLAMIKFVSISGWAIVIGYFIKGPLHWIFALYPPFLINQAYWWATDNNPLWIWALLGGTLYQLLAIWLLARLFKRSAYR